MWLFTTVGFFSATQVSNPRKFDLEDGTIQVRARVYEDLENLRSTYLPELSETICLKNRDYPYRGYVSKEALAAAMGRIVMDLNYSNFKDEVKKEQSKERADLYMGVWSIMYQAEHKLEDKKAKASAYKSRPTLNFERAAAKEMQEEDFDKELRRELNKQEHERDVRIARMDRTNAHTDFEDLTDPLTIEIMGLDHMSLVEESDLFRTPIDDTDDITAANEWAGVWAASKKKKKKKNRKNRRRGNR
jgi:hypothetical protein